MRFRTTAIIGAILAVATLLTPVPASADSGPLITVLFSRTEITPAIDCVPDVTGNAPLLTTVAPYMQSLGLTATGTLDMFHTGAAEGCTHGNESITASLGDAQQLASQYGWTFTPHVYLSAKKIASLTPQQEYDYTCGQAVTIESDGLPGATGMISYPGAQQVQTKLQTDDGQNCFAWGRTYVKGGVTDISTAPVAPYWQATGAAMGGPCNDKLATCYTQPATGSKRYSDPFKIIQEIQALQPGQWMTLQFYLLVSGTNPPGSNSQWDCTSANPEDHWSNDVERYCWSDAQLILQAIASQMQSPTNPLTVTDPLTAGIDAGRPATYPEGGNNHAGHGALRTLAVSAGCLPGRSRIAVQRTGNMARRCRIGRECAPVAQLATARLSRPPHARGAYALCQRANP